MIETVDSIALAQELNRQALKSETPSKYSFRSMRLKNSASPDYRPQRFPELLIESPAWPALRIRGLMTIPPYDPDPEKSRAWFHSLLQWRDRWQAQFPSVDLSQLSMGMSHDFEVAIEEGATIIRVGTALFGPRE